MKQGKSLVELASEIQRMAQNSEDMIIDTKMLVMDKGALGVKGQDIRRELTDYAHGQVAQRTGIPKRYYDTMRLRTVEPNGEVRSHVALLDENVNYWLRNDPEKRMLRATDNRIRAFLSDKYRRLDNNEFAETIFPIIQREQMEVHSSEITETRMYVKVLSPKFMDEVKVGDTVQFGIVLSNSEVGAGSLRIEPLLYRLVCKNGAIANTALRKYHVGRSGAELGMDRYMNILSEDTKRMDNRVFWRKVAEIVNYSMREDVFKKMVANAKDAANRELTAEPTEMIKKLSKTYSLNETEGESILNHLARGGDLSQWGVTNAVTRFSQDVDSYDRATELERIGGEILTLNPEQWKKLN